MYVKDRGAGFAHFVIDYGPEHHLMWVIFMDKTGECGTGRWVVARNLNKMVYKQRKRDTINSND